MPHLATYFKYLQCTLQLCLHVLDHFGCLEVEQHSLNTGSAVMCRNVLGDLIQCPAHFREYQITNRQSDEKRLHLQMVQLPFEILSWYIATCKAVDDRCYNVLDVFGELLPFLLLCTKVLENKVSTNE